MGTIKLNSNSTIIKLIKDINEACEFNPDSFITSVYKDLRKNSSSITTISDSIAQKALETIDISKIKTKDFKDIGNDFCDIFVSDILSIVVSRNSATQDKIKFLVIHNKSSVVQNAFYLDIDKMKISIAQGESKEDNENLNIQRGQVLSIYYFIIKQLSTLNTTEVGMKTTKKIGITTIKNNTKLKFHHIDID